VDKRYLSKRAISLKPSGIRKFFDIVATMDDVISLGIGEPDFVTPQPILQRGVRALQDGETHYTSNSGRLDLRQALAAHLQRLYGVTPCFVSYQAEVTLAGGVPVELPTFMEDNFQLRPEALETAITPRTKAILLGYPNNPTGAVASRRTLLEVARIAEQHDLIVLSDEIYDQLVYGVQHVCFPALPGMRERTVLLGGFSKNYAMTGWRIGYAAGPAGLIQGLLRVHQYTIMSAPTIAQFAALEALTNGSEYVSEMQAEYDRRRRLIVDGLNYLGLSTFEPHGAFYAFPSIAVTGLDDETFSEKLLDEERVAVVPGSAFGSGGEGFVRCSYATAYEKIEEALARLENFMKRYG